MKKTIIRVFMITLIVALLGGGYYVYTSLQSAEDARASFANIETVTIEEGNLVSTINATGKVRSGQSATLYWQTSGTVETVNVEVGDDIQVGEVLATLEQSSLPQDIILAQANLLDYHTALDDLYTNAETAKTKAVQDIATYTQAAKDAQYQLDNFTVPSNQADLDTMEALATMKERLDQAREAFQPYKYLSSGNERRQELKEALNEAQADYNSAVKRLQYETELEVAKDNLEKALQDYEKWKDGPTAEEITAAESRIAATEATLSKAWIQAPFDGTITVAHPQSGDQVSLNTEAFRLDDLSRLYVDIQVSEVDINQVKTDQEVTIVFDGIRNKEYHGTVVEVATIGGDTSGGVDFTVTVQLMDADEDVRPGMTSEVNIVVERRQAALLVPNQAIRRDENGAQVIYVMKPEEGLQPVEIKLGVSSDTHSEVLEGELQVGDQIALNPLTVPLSGEETPRGMFFGMRQMTGDGGSDSSETPQGGFPAGPPGQDEGAGEPGRQP